MVLNAFHSPCISRFLATSLNLETKLLMLNKWTLVFFDVHFRDVWPDDQFGSVGIGAEEEFMCLCDIFKMPLPNGESAKDALCMIHVTLWYYFPVLRYTCTSLFLLDVGSVKVLGILSGYRHINTIKFYRYSRSNLLGHLGRQFPLVMD